MRAAISGQRAAAPVRMSASQFESLAALIEQLADRCGAGGQARSCWLDGADASAGAIRSWVPLQYLEAARRHVERCEIEMWEARSQLQAREADNIRLTSLAFGIQPAC